jgi:hypothetical protein
VGSASEAAAGPAAQPLRGPRSPTDSPFQATGPFSPQPIRKQYAGGDVFSVLVVTWKASANQQSMTQCSLGVRKVGWLGPRAAYLSRNEQDSGPASEKTRFCSVFAASAATPTATATCLVKFRRHESFARMRIGTLLLELISYLQFLAGRNHRPDHTQPGTPGTRSQSRTVAQASIYEAWSRPVPRCSTHR